MNLADRDPGVKETLGDAYPYWDKYAPRRMAKRREGERRTKKGPRR